MTEKEKIRRYKLAEKTHKVCCNRRDADAGKELLEFWVTKGYITQKQVPQIIRTNENKGVNSKKINKKSPKKNGLILIKTEYSGTCYICSMSYLVGDQIFCNTKTKTGWHALCGSLADRKEVGYHWDKWVAEKSIIAKTNDDYDDYEE